MPGQCLSILQCSGYPLYLFRFAGLYPSRQKQIIATIHPNSEHLTNPPDIGLLLKDASKQHPYPTNAGKFFAVTLKNFRKTRRPSKRHLYLTNTGKFFAVTLKNFRKTRRLSKRHLYLTNTGKFFAVTLKNFRKTRRLSKRRSEAIQKVCERAVLKTTQYYGNLARHLTS